MAIELAIQVGNRIVKITVGGSATSQAQGASNTGRQGGQAASDPSGHIPGGGGPKGSGSGCGVTVIGPIVVDGTAMQVQSGQGGQAASDPSGHIPGGGKPERVIGGQAASDPSGHIPGGGGGPETGSSGCCPVVIGPIVISGCYSAEGTESSGTSSLPIAKALTLDPPLNSRTPDGAVFTMQPQEESDWCWAAVAVSVNDYFAKRATQWTQATLATKVVEADLGLPPNSLDCSKSPLQKKCNRPEGLDDALRIAGNLSDIGARFNQYLVFDSIVKWVDQQIPIGARIVWNRGGAHFIALDGYRELATGEQMVHVQDPIYRSSLQLYDDLVGDYLQLQTGGGKWQDTYPVQP